MNKKILYKLLLIFALLACILLINNTKSFATDGTSDNTITINDVTYKMPEWFFTKEYRFISLTRSGAGDKYGKYAHSYVLACSDTPFFITTSDSKYYLKSSNMLCYKYEFTTNNELDIEDDFSYEVSNELFLTSCRLTCLDEKVNAAMLSAVSYTNYDILNENNEVVFQQPPQVMEQETTLAPIVEGVEAKKTLAEVVGILPVVLVVIVGLLAMRKAIRFLMRILKQG